MSTGMRMTLAEYERLQKRSTESPPAAQERPQTRDTAKAALPRSPRGMNKLETRYAQQLELDKYAGEILWWAYEAVKLKLADRTHYTPDFAVLMLSGQIQIRETKGFMRDDAAVKIKVAARLFPIFDFYIIRWHKGEWTRTRVPG